MMITVTAQELMDLITKPAELILLNVRPASARGEACIAGSIHIPVAMLNASVKTRLPDKAAEIAVYGPDITCESSSRAADILEQLGYTQVYNLSSGLKGWVDAGFPVSVCDRLE